MREASKDKGRLEHILDAIKNAEEFTKNIDFEQYQKSALLRFGVTKAVEIVGEASYRLTNEFREQHPEIEWRKIINMRHVLVHGYYQMEDKIIWDTVHNNLPVLKEKIKLIYENL
ncbi:MAG: DUF86 domain-containing protein [Prevotellaceae bacterium]|jgi:uncharacterized protein with HEPN domain|nr:DUF86 domain-containing protein [Prevotellaceae bacterium]